MAESNSPWGRKPSGNSGNRGTGGGNPSGPGGKGPTPPPGGSPSLEKMMRDAHARMRGRMGSPGSSQEKQTLLLVGLLMLGLWLGSGFYRVNSDELGVVLRFGHYNRTSTPGLNYHLPYPVESVMIPSVTTVNKVEIGYRANGAENPNIRSGYGAKVDKAATAQNREGLMLTGDRNIVDIDFEVQWKIDAAHPEKFLFNMRDPAGNVKPVAESAMREVIGRNNLDDVLTGAQSQIAEDTKQLMQQMFDEYNAGIEIIAVNLSRPDVPPPVIDEFQDVKRAEQDKQTAVSVAEGYRNDILPRAKGDAAKMLEDAAAYKSKVTADALGDASRFKQIYAEYAQAKDVTKRRIYLETMEAVLWGMPKVIVEAATKNGGGVTPVLPLMMPAVKPPTETVAPATPLLPAPLPAAKAN